jgi:GNAT superfamily N-acetyltransferase
MSRVELLAEISAGVSFWGWEEASDLIGVMGVQPVHEVTLIRHAYVLPLHQGRGIGGKLLESLKQQVTTPLLIGTWAAATWAIAFYERHGFRLVADDERDVLLRRFWTVSKRQRDVSVVLTDEGVRS